jgi:superfamily II DNA or RNA helicase
VILYSGKGLYKVHDLIISKKNESFIKIDCDYGIGQELSDYFSFFVPGYKFMPSYKSRMWDGKIRLYNVRNSSTYFGLTGYIKSFCDERGYTLKIDSNLNLTDIFSVVEAKEFIDTLSLPFEVRDYQLNSFIHAIRNKKMLLLSPTASGKSLIIYLIISYLQRTKSRGLLVVPTVSLVAQMFKDFKSYGFDSESYCHMIHSGQEKQEDKFLYISTWQSIYNQPKKYFEQFNFVIGDEAHQFKAKSLTTILESCINAENRIGTTGTLDGTLTHKLVLEGLFGPVYKATSTSELIDNKQLSEFIIKCLILKYPEETCKKLKKFEYFNEIEYIISNNARNNFIKNLVLSLEGNSLVLFQYVEKHGKYLYNIIKEKAGDRKVFFVFGGTDINDREDVRAITEKETDAIIIASYGTFSTGINIVNLDNIVAASPSKSKIRVLQSIGRVLRLGNKKKAVLLDISDDFRIGKYINHTLKHFTERVKIYDEEKFEYKLYKIDLKNG